MKAWSIGCHRVLLNGPHRHLSARAKVELGHDVLNVIGGSLLRDCQRSGDLTVRPTLRDQSDYFQLPR